MLLLCLKLGLFWNNAWSLVLFLLYYQRDLRLKLQNLKQGDKGVEEYYQELLIGLARCGIHEDDEDISARFFGGLNRDIQNILDYKEWTRFSQLYHLALKAKREV